MGSTQKYQVFFTPLINADSSMYGDEIDVTDHIRYTGVGTIRRSIDSSDYDVGVFTFSDLELTALNVDGFFNEMDYRSIFSTLRDRCKVRIVFNEIQTVRNIEGTVLSEDTLSSVTFRGMINEEATRLDITNDTIRFKVLSRDSVLRTTKISGGAVIDGDLFSEALFQILNTPKVTAVLNISALNITPDLDLEIDDASFFNDKSIKESLDVLLFASNSCMLINDSGDVTIRSRIQDESSDVLNLFGKNDIHYRENIIDITSYNSGKQRMFTSFLVNDEEFSNVAFVQAFGFRQKEVTFDFITDPLKIQTIAAQLVDEWKTPKVELNVKVPTAIAKSVQLLDRVSLNNPFRLRTAPGTFLPIIGITKIGETDQPLPWTFGSVEILPRVKFKVIEIEDNVENFTSILKLRQTGKDIGDGVFDEPGSCIIGFAVIGDGIICSGGDPCNAFNPANIGSAQIGCTVIS